jgi:uncharacterized membrane protein
LTEEGQSLTRFPLKPSQTRLDRWLSIALTVVILGLLATIGYLLIQPKSNENYTEFYDLGINGQAADYPSDFTLNNGHVVAVEYGSLSTVYTQQWGSLTLGIVNHEGRDTTYTMMMQIDGNKVGIPFQGNTVNQIGPVALTPEEKWEQVIGIIPQHTGDNQEVEILLYKNGGAEPYLNLSLWINVN